jgi:Tol biopolymer transport system component
VLPQLFFGVFAGFFSTGCIEYNRIATVSEQNSLSDIVQLTDGFDRAGEAFFSPDGRWVVFRAVPTGGLLPRLYLAKVNLDSPKTLELEPPICITPGGSSSEHGSFSRDGMSFIFASTARSPDEDQKPPRIMRLFRADGWEGMIAMADRNQGLDLAQHALGLGRMDCSQCAFSPDGTWICFAAGEKGSRRLMVMHPDRSHLAPLTDPKDDATSPAFSPDGKSLLYQAGSSGSAQIMLANFTFDRDGNVTGIEDIRALTHDQENNVNPAWYPTGTHIIYSTSRHGRDNYELYLMDRYGRHKTRITFCAGADLMPVFSSDGKVLMWTSKRAPDGSDEIFAAKFKFPPGSY